MKDKNRQEIMALIAEWFGVEPDDDGTYDIDDYDWRAGCSTGGFGSTWMCLAEMVKCIESNADGLFYILEDELF